jgi:hypothetical protein
MSDQRQPLSRLGEDLEQTRDDRRDGENTEVLRRKNADENKRTQQTHAANAPSHGDHPKRTPQHMRGHIIGTGLTLAHDRFVLGGIGGEDDQIPARAAA